MARSSAHDLSFDALRATPTSVRPRRMSLLAVCNVTIFAEVFGLVYFKHNPARDSFQSSGSHLSGGIVNYQRSMWFGMRSAVLFLFGGAFLAGCGGGSDTSFSPPLGAQVTEQPLAPQAADAGITRAPVANGSWAETRSLSFSRFRHLAVSLGNDKVIVAGGLGEGGSNAETASVEVYEGRKGKWSVAASMTTGRYAPSGSPLPDGKLLVAGGSSSGYPLSSAELYDSTSDSWVLTGSMATGRYGATATLLASGKVLVVGGFGAGFVRPVPSAELYDPVTGTWSSAGSMGDGRFNATATLLPNGKVFVAGGFSGDGGLATTEIYDPNTNSWSAGTPMATNRIGHSATLLPNGRLLIAGGIAWVPGGEPVVLADSALYDPVTATWSATGAMNGVRTDHSATLLLSGKVLVAGGSTNGPSLSTAEIFDPSIGAWSVTPSMAAERQSHSATLLPWGQVLIAGGRNSVGDPIAGAEIYTPPRARPN